MNPYYYVFRPDSRHPAVKHQTQVSAVTEAERLAVQHPGVCFDVVKVIAVVRTAQVSTTWMDGENPV